MDLGIWGKKAHHRVPWRKFRLFSIFQQAVSYLPVTFNLILLSMRNHNPCATEHIFLSPHEIDLVPRVFQVSPLCLPEHPILFRSLLMALNKYTFWDLTEQAVLFHVTSKAAY